MEILVFLIPTASMIKNIIDRTVFSDRSATRFIYEIDKYGMKGHFLRNPLGLLSILSLIASYWYIGLGWLWAGIGLVILAGLVLFMLFPSQRSVMPKVGTNEYAQLIKKRRKQAGIQAILLCLWGLSWATT